MSTLPAFRLRELVVADLPTGRHLGRITAYEPGQHLRHYGGPFPTWAYHVRIEGIDGDTTMVVTPEERLFRLGTPPLDNRHPWGVAN